MSNENSTNNSDNAKKEIQKKWKERQEEMHLLERFKVRALSRLDEMSRESNSKEKYKLGSDEQKIIRQLNGMGLPQGIAAGIITFAVLRRGPIYIARILHRRQQQQPYGGPPSSPNGNRDTYRLSNPNITSSFNSIHNNNPFQRARQPEFPRSKNWFVRAVWFTFDATLSMMMGASVSMAYTDVDKIRHDLLELPLVEGRSLVSDALCDDIIQELSQIRDENPPSYQRLRNDIKERQHQERRRRQPAASTSSTFKSGNPNSMYLESIEIFVKNCQRRRYAEWRVREAHGIPNNQPVELKNPVPRDGPRLLMVPSPNPNADHEDRHDVGPHFVYDDDDDDDDENYSNIMDGNTFSDSDQSTKWTDAFVVDQGESSSNDKEDDNRWDKSSSSSSSSGRKR
jgi:hypothetical protein